MNPLQKSTQRREGWQVFAAGFVLAFFALAPAFWPYGGRFIVRGDYIEQQIPFLLETRRMLLSGAPFWSWNSLLGSNFLGNYAFYTVGSPFVWLLLPLPEAALPYGITVVAMLKQAVAAWTAFLYLRRFVQNPRYAQLGALLYAFSGFTIINTQFYHFTDIIAVFPLIPLALEDAFAERPHPGALALACGLNVLVNYYFFLGTAIFVCLYGAFRFFSADWRPTRSFKRLFWAVFECGLGCLLAAVLLFPAAWAMLGISRTGRFLMFDFSEQYHLGDLLERVRVLLMPIESSLQHAFYGTAAQWASVGAFLPLFGLVPLLYSLRRRPVTWHHGLFLLLLLISMIAPVNRLFVLGSNNTYTRWWYALVLVLCVITAQALDGYDPKLSHQRRWMTAGWLISLVLTALMTVPFLLPSAWIQTLASGSTPLAGAASFVLRQQAAPGYAPGLFRAFSMGAWALNLGLCFLVLRPGVFRRGRWVLGALMLCAAVNYTGFVYLNNVHHESGNHVEYVTGLDYYVYHELEQEKPVHEGTTYTYRVDYPSKILNYGMLINQPAISTFHSIRSGYVDDYLMFLGLTFSELPYTLPPDASDGATRALLGVKYYYNYDEEHYPGAPNGFELTRQEGGVNVYESAYALPIGFAYTHYATHYYTPVLRHTASRIMLNAVVLDHLNIDDFSDWMPRIEEEDLLPWKQAALARLENACYDVEMTTRGLTAKIDLAEKQLVFFSVPYDKGWSATVNGEAAQVHRVNMSFIGIVAEAGDAIEIELRFLPRGLREGAIVSVIAALVLAAYTVLRRRRGFDRA